MEALSKPNEWKTGQRVPFDGHYIDQHGRTSFHEAHHTFPPCIGRKGESAVRRLCAGQETNS